MADKKSPASGWPIIQGDYHTGDANSPVAVVGIVLVFAAIIVLAIKKHPAKSEA